MSFLPGAGLQVRRRARARPLALPYEGVRGLASYREVWPPFFAWQAQGACFEIEELEVTAGEDVAFALLRCGTEEELAERPEARMRLTLGLRKEEGRWVVAHEHHSFPDLHGPDEQARAGLVFQNAGSRAVDVESTCLRPERRRSAPDRAKGLAGTRSPPRAGP
ncbi:nuclear transport factor 2 family protein [Streptomyces sp. 110]|uniref:Nuclear transport factor 2 family protein n=1 Tax=Streptomyces endocoffeicus TaxID=2898945 RepID=A0ABS1Q4P4_9ACTN|nr:nuclear transport factor 2 family protein [Streptomyces endocoffeicus]